MRLVFYPIKHRVIYRFWKVVRTSVAGQLSTLYTVSGLAREIIFPFQRYEPGAAFPDTGAVLTSDPEYGRCRWQAGLVPRWGGWYGVVTRWVPVQEVGT